MHVLQMLGYLCLLAGILLIRTDIQRGYGVFTDKSHVKDHFAKLTGHAKQSFLALQELPTWSQLVSAVGDGLARIRSKLVSSVTNPARAARTAAKMPAVEKEEKEEKEETWALDEPAAAIGEGEDSSVYTEIFVDINEKPTLFRYVEGTAGGTSEALATGYCKDPTNGLGLISTEWADCIATLSVELGKIMHPAAHVAPAATTLEEVDLTDAEGAPLSAHGVRQLPLEVNGVTYVFEYHVDLDFTFTAERLAREFCAAKGVGIGLFVEGDAQAVVKEKCLSPLMKAIRVELVIAKNGLNV